MWKSLAAMWLGRLLFWLGLNATWPNEEASLRFDNAKPRTLQVLLMVQTILVYDLFKGSCKFDGLNHLFQPFDSFDRKCICRKRTELCNDHYRMFNKTWRCHSFHACFASLLSFACVSVADNGFAPEAACHIHFQGQCFIKLEL